VVLAGKLATLRLRRRSDDNNPIIGSETVR
jgi:hypothetical protein